MKTILIVEDEQDLAELIAYNLGKEGYNPVIALDGAAALQSIRISPPDLILLDLMLPGMMGTEICRLLKQKEKTSSIPIIMVTARGEEIDRVVGFEMGVEDYIMKPFSMRELLLRIKAVLRRTFPETSPSKVRQVGPILIDAEQYRVSVNGEEISLTTTEFKLLHNLADRLGRVQSRELLLQEVWGYNYTGDTRTVDTHITRLRTKLGEAGNIIKTVRGFGYRIEEE